jgi:ABC-type lipoprotein export system ATPase subunit
LHCLAGLDRPSSGSVHIGDADVTRLDDKRLTLLCRDHVGFVFQKFNLLPALSAAENILLPLAIAGREPDPAWFKQIVAAVVALAASVLPARRAVSRRWSSRSARSRAGNLGRAAGPGV